MRTKNANRINNKINNIKKLLNTVFLQYMIQIIEIGHITQNGKKGRYSLFLSTFKIRGYKLNVEGLKIKLVGKVGMNYMS